MKTIAKKVIPFIITVCLLLSLLTVSVSAAGSSIAFSKNKLVIGETLTVTVRFSTASGDPMYGLEGYITYDPSVLECISNAVCNVLTPGKAKIVLQSAGKTNLSETVQFKATKSGSSVVALETLVYVDSNDSEQTLTGASATVTVTDPSAQASSDANLKGLSVSAGALSPKFSPDVTEYTVTITNDVTELYVNASKSDAAATYTVKGSKDMKVGKNQRSIVVTAENGNTKTYTITIIRLDENGNVPPEEGDTPLNDITEVTVDGEILYVQEDFGTETTPAGFSVIDYAFDGKTIPALGDGEYILIYLGKPDGTGSDFYVVDGKDKFIKVYVIDNNGVAYTVLPTKELPNGYTAANGCVINEVTVPAYKSDAPEMADFYLIYAKGPAGQNGFYHYDTVDKTFQRAIGLSFEEKGKDDQQIDNPNDSDRDIIAAFMGLGLSAKIVMITILAIIVLLIVAVVILIVKIASDGRNKQEIEESAEEDEDSMGFEYISIGEPINNTAAEEIELDSISEQTEETAQEEAEENVAEPDSDETEDSDEE